MGFSDTERCRFINKDCCRTMCRQRGRQQAGTTCSAQPIQVSGCAGMSLYQVLHELQIVLALILGACPLCHQPLTPGRLEAAQART